MSLVPRPSLVAVPSHATLGVRRPSSRPLRDWTRVGVRKCANPGHARRRLRDETECGPSTTNSTLGGRRVAIGGPRLT
jgi:hypothetical protein